MIFRPFVTGHRCGDNTRTTVPGKCSEGDFELFARVGLYILYVRGPCSSIVYVSAVRKKAFIPSLCFERYDALKYSAAVDYAIRFRKFSPVLADQTLGLTKNAFHNVIAVHHLETRMARYERRRWVDDVFSAHRVFAKFGRFFRSDRLDHKPPPHGSKVGERTRDISSVSTINTLRTSTVFQIREKRFAALIVTNRRPVVIHAFYFCQRPLHYYTRTLAR